jgi:nucleotide-binding universal stress UspA family protein
MQTVKRIMAPLAFSPYSKGIIDYAAMLAKGLDVEELILINVLNERDVEAVERVSALGYEVDEEHYIEKIQHQRANELEKMMEDVDFPNDKIRVIMTVGRPAEKLLKKALEERVDLIVMGIKAKSELVHAFTGSVAEKLFHRSPITIVSYREESIAEKLRSKLHF